MRVNDALMGTIFTKDIMSGHNNTDASADTSTDTVSGTPIHTPTHTLKDTPKDTIEDTSGQQGSDIDSQACPNQPDGSATSSMTTTTTTTTTTNSEHSAATTTLTSRPPCGSKPRGESLNSQKSRDVTKPRGASAAECTTNDTKPCPTTGRSKLHHYYEQIDDLQAVFQKDQRSGSVGSRPVSSGSAPCDQPVKLRLNSNAADRTPEKMKSKLYRRLSFSREKIKERSDRGAVVSGGGGPAAGDPVSKVKDDYDCEYVKVEAPPKGGVVDDIKRHSNASKMVVSGNIPASSSTQKLSNFFHALQRKGSRRDLTLGKGLLLILVSTVVRGIGHLLILGKMVNILKIIMRKLNCVMKILYSID